VVISKPLTCQGFCDIIEKGDEKMQRTMTSLTNQFHKERSFWNRAKEDEMVEQMIAEWDIVTCHECGKKISMLHAKPIGDGKYFICEEH
jgi:hypothetical protein